MLSILGSKHQKPAERIYGSIGLKNRLSASDLARLAVKHHFIAADIFLSKTLQDSMSANDLASMGLHGSNYCLVMILNNDQLRNRVEPDYLKQMEKRYQSVAALQAAIKPIAEIEKEIKEEKVEKPKLRARKR